mgnify:CR=1 FL=1
MIVHWTIFCIVRVKDCKSDWLCISLVHWYSLYSSHLFILYDEMSLQAVLQFSYCSIISSGFVLFHDTISLSHNSKMVGFFKYNIHYKCTCITSLNVEMMYVCYILYFVIWSYCYKCKCPRRPLIDIFINGFVSFLIDFRLNFQLIIHQDSIYFCQT